MHEEKFNRTEERRDEAFMALNRWLLWRVYLPVSVVIVIASWL